MGDWHRQWNPTKAFIDLCARLGFVWGRKRAHGHWDRRRKHWKEHYGKDPVGGLRGMPPFQHREVDYEIFETFSPVEVEKLHAAGKQHEIPAEILNLRKTENDENQETVSDT